MAARPRCRDGPIDAHALAFFLFALLLAGCAIGPDYSKPDIKTPDRFTADAAPLSVPLATEADLTAWWTQFHDAELNSLINRALAANLDLQSAASRVREAREQEIIAGAAGAPSVSATSNAAHLHSGRNFLSQLGGGQSSSSSSSSSSSQPASGGTDVSVYSLGFDASWELDVFGGVRRSVEAAEAGSEAAHWQMRDGEVTLTAEIAANYIILRAAQARIALLQGELQSQNATLDLVSARAKTGFVTELDVNQQYALKSSTEAQIPSLEAEVTTNEHAIAVLLAADPNSLAGELNATAPLPDIPASLPVGLPSDLLRRRPDVRQAERKLAQATAEQGVAIAALYPKFSLTGYLTLSSNSLGGLFNSTSLSQLGLASISWPIFHGGEARANIAAKDEERLQAYYAYQRAVLVAVQDAEDALVRYAAEQRRFVSLNEAVTRNRSSTAIALQQYQAGLTTYINVLTAQSTELQASDQLAQSKQALAVDVASLYKALGGGWKDDDNDLGLGARAGLGYQAKLVLQILGDLVFRFAGAGQLQDGDEQALGARQDGQAQAHEDHRPQHAIFPGGQGARRYEDQHQRHEDMAHDDQGQPRRGIIGADMAKGFAARGAILDLLEIGAEQLAFAAAGATAQDRPARRQLHGNLIHANLAFHEANLGPRSFFLLRQSGYARL